MTGLQEIVLTEDVVARIEVTHSEIEFDRRQQCGGEGENLRPAYMVVAWRVAPARQWSSIRGWS